MTIAGNARRILAAQDSDHLADAAVDIRRAMREHWGLTVTAAATFDMRGHRGWCDGMSITKSRLVLYRATGSRRESFTLAHELAHVLVDEDEDCYNWLADRPQPDRDLEQICDVIASSILLPETALDAVLAGQSPAASTVAELYDHTGASRSACVVAIAQRLPCDGFIAIIDTNDHSVFFAARARDTYPYAWRGDQVPNGHHLRREDLPAAALSWWPKYNINDRRAYYLSTYDAGNYLYAMFAENDLWGAVKLHLPDAEEADTRYDGTIDCPSCGYMGRTALFPCPTCHAATCQKCQECDCDRANRVVRTRCSRCTASVLPHLLEDGLCPACR